MSAQPWICGACRSVNQPREGRCYRCRTPRDLVEADPGTLLVAGAGSRPTETVVKPTAPYRDTGNLAFLAQVLLAAALAIAVVANVLGADLIGRVLDGETAGAETSPATLGLIGGLGFVLAGASLVAFAVWLGRVIANVPRIGLGWPNLTPNQVMFETLIPGVNLYRVPAVLRDVVNRLEPHGRGDALIAAAWLGLVGGVLVPRLGSWAIVFLVGSLDDFTAFRVLLGQVGLGLTVTGGIVLVGLIQWIEGRMEQRSRGERLTDAPTVPAQPVDPTGSGHSLDESPAAGGEARSAGTAETAPPPRLSPAPSAHWTAAVRSSAPRPTEPAGDVPDQAR
jgi:hypothetical protein